GEGVTKEGGRKSGRLFGSGDGEKNTTVFRHTRGWCHQSSFKRDGEGVAEEIKSREILNKKRRAVALLTKKRGRDQRQLISFLVAQVGDDFTEKVISLLPSYDFSVTALGKALGV